MTILRKKLRSEREYNEDLEFQHERLKQELQKKKEPIERPVHKDQFNPTYRSYEAKSNILKEGDCCIVCGNAPDMCGYPKSDGRLCKCRIKEHTQTRLGHRFKAQGEADKCSFKNQDGQLCGCCEMQHQGLGHKFNGAGLCKSHFYPNAVLKEVCKKETNSLIYDGISNTSCTPDGCNRRLICALCEPVTSKLEEELADQ